MLDVRCADDMVPRNMQIKNMGQSIPENTTGMITTTRSPILVKTVIVALNRLG